MSSMLSTNNSGYHQAQAFDLIRLTFGIVYIFGFFANTFIFYILVTYSSFQAIPYKLIRITVISDILSSFAVVFGNINTSAEKSVESGTALCRAVMFMIFLSNGVSMFNLSYIAIDRYFSIVKPFHRYYRLHRKRIFYFASITIWIVVASYTAIMYPHLRVSHQDTTLCDFPTISQNWDNAMMLFVFITMQYLIPCTIIILAYTKIIKHQRNHIRPGISEDMQQADGTRRKKFVRMLVSITLCYILCTLPFFATVLGMAITRKSVIEIRNQSMTKFLLLYISMFLSIGIVVVNPVIYVYFDINIRHKSLAILHKIKNRLTIHGLSNSKNSNNKTSSIILVATTNITETNLEC